MRGMLLLMEHFNDWDLQAVVRSCSSFAHLEEPVAGPHVAAVWEAEVEAPVTAPARADVRRGWRSEKRCKRQRRGGSQGPIDAVRP
uniref:Uncharacterized protein n=1 Tax=Arundo donax TaxID=35708 RepID=A0A0A8Y810_ARUDO